MMKIFLDRFVLVHFMCIFYKNQLVSKVFGMLMQELIVLEEY